MLYLPIIVSLFAIAFAYFLIRKIEKAPSGSAKMIENSAYIREGAVAYLKRQFKAVGLVAAVLFLILWIGWGVKVGMGFLMGAAASAAAALPLLASAFSASATESPLISIRHPLNFAKY